MDKPFIRVSANDKYDRMVGIQITERRFKIFYPGKKEPNITYNGQETYCMIYGSYSGDFYVDNNPLALYDYDYIEFVFENNMYFSSDKTELLAAISGIKHYDIPEGVVKVRDGAFCGCCNIDSIKFPSTLKFITTDAFDYEMPEFKSIFVPKGSRQFYEEIFEDFKEEIKEY